MLDMWLSTVLCTLCGYLCIVVLWLSPFLVCRSDTISLLFIMLLLPGLLCHRLFPLHLLSSPLPTLMSSYCLYRLINLAQDTTLPRLMTCSDMMTIGKQACNGNGRTRA